MIRLPASSKPVVVARMVDRVTPVISARHSTQTTGVTCPSNASTRAAASRLGADSDREERKDSSVIWLTSACHAQEARRLWEPRSGQMRPGPRRQLHQTVPPRECKKTLPRPDPTRYDD